MYLLGEGHYEAEGKVKESRSEKRDPFNLCEAKRQIAGFAAKESKESKERGEETGAARQLP